LILVTGGEKNLPAAGRLVKRCSNHASLLLVENTLVRTIQGLEESGVPLDVIKGYLVNVSPDG
jgi:hypothetical protein